MNFFSYAITATNFVL